MGAEAPLTRCLTGDAPRNTNDFVTV
jgi:hypothetical protein